MPTMSDAQVMTALRSATTLNRARQRFSSSVGAMEQAASQRRPPGPIEVRRMEFEAVAEIAAALGVEVNLMADPERAVRLVVQQVEIWVPPAEPGGTIDVTLMTVAANREAALAYVAAHPDASRSEDRWCWKVYGVEVGDPKGRPIDGLYLSPTGQEHGCPGDAWEASAEIAAPIPGR